MDTYLLVRRGPAGDITSLAELDPRCVTARPGGTGDPPTAYDITHRQPCRCPPAAHPARR